MLSKDDLNAIKEFCVLAKLPILKELVPQAVDELLSMQSLPEMSEVDAEYARIIAHLIRNGKVLAEICDPKNDAKTFTFEEIAEMKKKRDSAIAAIAMFDGLEVGE